MSVINKRKNSKVVQKKQSIKVMIKNNWQIYVLIFPSVLYFFVFEYLPMYGIQVAFRDYQFVKGISGSDWVGLKYFKQFFNAYYFKRLILNTLLLNLYSLIWSAPIPMILAILLNRVKHDRRKRAIQTTIYVPHFISTVVMAGMIYIFLSPTGIFNVARSALGLNVVSFMSEPSAFRTIYIASTIWQNAGYSSILFLATLTSVDQCLYEAAEIDGASVLQQIKYIDLPSVVPTFMMTFILDCGRLLSSNTNKALLLQTAGNTPVSDVIGVYVYNVGLGGGQFSYTSAIGLFTNVINFILIITVNKISKKISNTGLF